MPLGRRAKPFSSTVGAAFAIALLGGCSLIVTTTGLSGGTTDGKDEAGSNPGDGSAGTDGRTDGKFPTTDPCAAAVICDDFERDDVQGPWRTAYVDKGGKFEIDTSTSNSPSRSLVMTVPGTNEPHAQLISPDYPNVDHVRVTFAMKAESPAREMAHMRVEIAEENRDRTGAINLFSLPGRFVMTEQVFGSPSEGYGDFEVDTGFKPNTWQTWSMELDARQKPTMAILTLDGVERLRKSLKNTMAKGTLTITVGALYAPDGPVRRVSYDDIAIQILP